MREMKEVSIRDLVRGYHDDDENGCWAMDGKLNIRPQYQRNFCYDDKRQNLVIDTIMKGDRMSLNLFSWVKVGDAYEMIDGQQRTISICRYIMGEFAYRVSKNDPMPMTFAQLSQAEKDRILDYKIHVQVMEFDTNKEKLEYFERINVAALTLNDQELRNAAYPGPFITSAKSYFSKRNGPVHTKMMVDNKHAGDYMRGDYDRQDWLETALEWYGDGDIITCMSTHQVDTNASAMWAYYERVMDWVRRTFKHYRKEMKGLDYGSLFGCYGQNDYDPDELEKRIKELMMNSEITKKSGIYYYIFDGDESHLNIRQFPVDLKTSKWEEQEHRCAHCGKELEFKDARADHVTSWIHGGKTEYGNLQILCADCNGKKSGA